ncbi:LysR family transcriptional regulator [Marinomonas rhizomae]|uniref:LysR family transcriptional regulator n=1 Tax=Marinomonas rhizomae TaxID=491948 RepID=A0A366J916_9GAMM|nr:LysR family transcriptional regulator [Marinomonas rhizomae]RBP83432.1 LysR family transcriptional regulator [Marinomonas rhizomae]RNF73986.1 LysR family transcriptional regulator [Marinomonas rhizomae]
MDRVTAAKVFIDVAQSRSFTVTAERLNMSRPMVTRYMEAMEDWLKTRLLHRTTRKISLTTAGEACLKDVELWLEQAEKITALANSGKELSGLVRITTSMSFGFSQLMPAIQDFMQLYPKVRVDIDLEDSTADLTEKSIDLAIRIASNPDPSLIGKPIAVCESVLVASPEYLDQAQQALGRIQQPQDLSPHDCLGYKNFEQHIWHLSKHDQFESITVDCRLTINEATAILHGTLNGVGISMLPTYLANRYINDRHLCHVLPEWKPKDLIIYALYSSRKHLSPNVRALIDHLEQYFAEHPW